MVLLLIESLDVSKTGTHLLLKVFFFIEIPLLIVLNLASDICPPCNE